MRVQKLRELIRSIVLNEISKAQYDDRGGNQIRVAGVTVYEPKPLDAFVTEKLRGELAVRAARRGDRIARGEVSVHPSSAVGVERRDCLVDPEVLNRRPVMVSRHDVVLDEDGQIRAGLLAADLIAHNLRDIGDGVVHSQGRVRRDQDRNAVSGRIAQERLGEVAGLDRPLSDLVPEGGVHAVHLDGVPVDDDLAVSGHGRSGFGHRNASSAYRSSAAGTADDSERIVEETADTSSSAGGKGGTSSANVAPLPPFPTSATEPSRFGRALELLAASIRADTAAILAAAELDAHLAANSPGEGDHSLREFGSPSPALSPDCCVICDAADRIESKLARENGPVALVRVFGPVIVNRAGIAVLTCRVLEVSE